MVDSDRQRLEGELATLERQYALAAKMYAHAPTPRELEVAEKLMLEIGTEIDNLKKWLTCNPDPKAKRAADT